jgi:hypothetical protein
LGGVAPLDSVQGICWVLDLASYCKGRPKGASGKEKDVYICDLKVDKKARAFNKVTKNQNFPVNTFSYAFDMFQSKLTVKRTYTPHKIPDAYQKNGNGAQKNDKSKHGSQKGKGSKPTETTRLMVSKEEKEKKKKRMDEMSKALFKRLGVVLRGSCQNLDMK